MLHRCAWREHLVAMEQQIGGFCEGDGMTAAERELMACADLRDYGTGAQMLVDLGLTSIRIMTNNPKKIKGLQGYGLSVTEQVPIESAPNEYNVDYLRTKRDRMEHALHHQGLAFDEEMIQEEHARDRDLKQDPAPTAVKTEGDNA